jgi:hypothetical protein
MPSSDGLAAVIFGRFAPYISRCLISLHRVESAADGLCDDRRSRQRPGNSPQETRYTPLRQCFSAGPVESPGWPQVVYPVFDKRRGNAAIAADRRRGVHRFKATLCSYNRPDGDSSEAKGQLPVMPQYKLLYL